ncbi:MAG: AAA family ATPase [Candidatus Accumulibacter sp.]|jgi:DNA repair exonuclease SbcCD ATPase subunit|nr:AAA family ATPase [Accumulibacter sp.]
MRLLSASVSNYRVHKETKLAFDPQLTVIGGANESGKSTLVEAIHCALFLPAQGTTETHRKMRSETHGGLPEVEVRFETAGAVYTVRKLFRGPNGTASLTQAGGRTWSNEEAHEKLGELLGVPNSGRGTGVKAESQWQHLWVWQGRSGDDPADALKGQSANLVQRLQRLGGAALIQSALDAAIADKFEKARAEIFTANGKYRTGSEPDRAEKAWRAAAGQARKAGEECEALEAAVNAHDQAVAEIERLESDIAGQRRQLADVVDKLKRVQALRQTEARQAGDSAQSARALERLQGVDKEIRELKKHGDELALEFAPLQAALRAFEENERQARQAAEFAQQTLADAQARREQEQARKDLADEWLRCFEKEARYLELEKRLAQTDAVRGRIDALNGRLAVLPEMSQKNLGRLRELENERFQAKTELDALAAEIELLATDVAVTLGGEAMKPGEKRRVTDAAEIRAGNTTLRIRPGGGKSLDEARDAHARCEARFKDELREARVKNLAEAEAALEKRRQLSADVQAEQKRLEALDAEGRLRSDHGAAKNEWRAAAASIVRAGGREGDVATQEEAQARCRDAQAGLEQAKRAETQARLECDARREAQAAARDKREEAQAKAARIGRRLDEVNTRLSVLSEQNGDDDARAAGLADALAAAGKAESELAGTREALRALDPERLDAAMSRLERALAQLGEGRQQAEERRIRSETLLRSDGSLDPHAALEELKARERRAQEAFAVAERYARAVRRLDELFKEEQRTASETLSRPFAEKIGGYLGFVFPGARAQVRMDDGKQLGGIELIRGDGGALAFDALSDGGALAFDALSGGAREQVAAAVRLAAAELLAEEHGGCLPVVFDDAFAYSDPERVQTLQGMLDLAARRGLQVIVLSCNLSDYAGLGALQLSL